MRCVTWQWTCVRVCVTVAVVVAFFCCWAPYHAQRLMTLSISYDGWTPSLLELQNVLFYMSGTLTNKPSTLCPKAVYTYSLITV